ncbi:hypothetical protein T484DRAFT_1808353 [Baffinella frigidus]|nr:hypothetical protein T484DRAFT_1808353 [Cryptophyta sp. CCMP2293]
MGSARIQGQVCGACGAHGRCVNAKEGACECEADWVGARCEHHLLSHTHFLPPPRQGGVGKWGAGRGCWDARQWEEGVHTVTSRQNPTSCDSEDVTAVVDNARHPLALGHGLRWEALMLGEAVGKGSARMAAATLSALVVVKV